MSPPSSPNPRPLAAGPRRHDSVDKISRVGRLTILSWALDDEEDAGPIYDDAFMLSSSQSARLLSALTPLPQNPDGFSANVQSPTELPQPTTPLPPTTPHGASQTPGSAPPEKKRRQTLRKPPPVDAKLQRSDSQQWVIVEDSTETTSNSSFYYFRKLVFVASICLLLSSALYPILGGVGVLKLLDLLDEIQEPEAPCEMGDLRPVYICALAVASTTMVFTALHLCIAIYQVISRRRALHYEDLPFTNASLTDVTHQDGSDEVCPTEDQVKPGAHAKTASAESQQLMLPSAPAENANALAIKPFKPAPSSWPSRGVLASWALLSGSLVLALSWLVTAALVTGTEFSLYKRVDFSDDVDENDDPCLIFPEDWSQFQSIARISTAFASFAFSALLAGLYIYPKVTCGWRRRRKERTTKRRDSDDSDLLLGPGKPMWTHKRLSIISDDGRSSIR